MRWPELIVLGLIFGTVLKIESNTSHYHNPQIMDFMESTLKECGHHDCSIVLTNEMSTDWWEASVWIESDPIPEQFTPGTLYRFRWKNIYDL